MTTEPRVSNVTMSGGNRADIIVNDIHYKYDSRERQCLVDLRVTDPRDDKKRIEETKGGLLRDSYRWILEVDDFQRWRNDPEAQLLWIKGDPGKGKTMLLCGIIDELERTIPIGSQLAFFFCQISDPRTNSLIAVLRGLIYLLVIQHPALIRHVQRRYELESRMFEGVNAQFALTETLENILFDPDLGTAYLVIDALDECVTDMGRLLDIIVSSSYKSTHVKWIVSSRKNREVERYLRSAKSLIRLSLEENAHLVSGSVDAYIDNLVYKLSLLQDDLALMAQVRNILHQKSNGSFLWVSLVAKELQHAEPWDVLQVLEEVPTDLYSLYGRMMSQIRQLKRKLPQFCLSILSVAVLSYRPLYVAELGFLSELPENISARTGNVLDIVTSCGSFLTVRNDLVYLIHQSAKDYLTDGPGSSKLFPSGLEKGHNALFSRSLELMYGVLRRDICNLRYPGFSISNSPVMAPHELAQANYSCVYWIDHLCDSDIGKGGRTGDELQAYGAVHAFLREKYLYWLEALSLLGSMSAGILAMQKLETLLGFAENQPLNDLVQDARRFILLHKQIIEVAPLQTYVSALVFSPALSLVRELFQAEVPAWIAKKPLIEADWSACLMTLEGHRSWVRSVAFSTGGHKLASASDDSTIRLWDIATGQCLQTVEGQSGWLRSVAFSPSGQLVASASSDGTIMIWYTETGESLRILEGHEGWVRSIAFSADSSQLASASDDKTVKIWDEATGHCVSTLEGHSDWVNAVAFSADGRHLASASDDMTIRIWDAATSQHLQTLEGHDGWVRSVTFSLEGRLASASSDNTIRTWDIVTGQTLQIFKGHSSWVKSVAFSADSQQLASASDDETIKIWDSTTGECLQTLEGHSDWVNAVAFSPDGRQLASASGDKTIKVWDTAISQRLQILDGHSDWVRLVAFLADGKRLASASDDKTIKIWDIATSQCIQTLEGYTGSVNAIALSVDGQRLALAHGDESVDIWDIATGKYLRSVDEDPADLSLDPDDSYLLSEVRRIRAETSPQPQADILGSDDSTAAATTAAATGGPAIVGDDPKRHGYDLSLDRSWITHNGEDVLWLPTEYRAQCSAVSGLMVCIGCRSGRVLFFEFFPDLVA